MKPKRLLLLFAALGVALVGTSLAAGSLASHASTQQLTLYVFSGKFKIKGPDGKAHDTIVPSNFVVKAGVRVKVTVINYDEAQHSITAPGLKLDLLIKGGKENKATGVVTPVTSTFTFTANKKGVYRWYCKIPCDHKANLWAMGPGFGGPGKEGFMAGYIVVI
jgi:plastocyanin